MPAACVDTIHDPANCGACGKACAFNQHCTNGTCVNGLACDTGQTRCGGAGVGIAFGCYTAQQLASSPLHCSNQPGNCGAACATNQVCAQGTCTDFFASASCTTSPCPACGTGTTCCMYPGTMEAVCVDGAVCPQ